MDSLKEALTKILEVKDPWFIEKIDVHSETKTVNVFINFEKDTKFCCSKCGLKSKEYDSSYRVWRHLDLVAKIIFDKFHIKKALNEAVDKVRKKEVIYCEHLKKTKYIWLKNTENLTIEQKNKLAIFLEESTTETAHAYKLKTAFDQLWRIQQNAIEPTLNQWLVMVEKTEIKPMLSFTKTVINHFKGIVNSMKSLVTNALSEGLNSVFQLSKYRARGYRNVNNFISMIYLLGNDFKFNFH